MTAKTLSVTDLRANFSSIMGRVVAGERFIVTRRGKRVAQISPPKHRKPEWPDFAALRAKMGPIKGEPMSQLISRMRDEGRL